MNINSFKLKDREQLFKMFEAMQYAFGREPETEYDKLNQVYWIKGIIKSIDPSLVELIKQIKCKHQKELQQSPILSGLLDAYVKASDATDFEKYRQIYQDFQALQKQYKYDDNKQVYFDAGCALTFSSRFLEPDKLYVMYPIFLFTAYQEKGGRDDDNRGGYLFPTQKLDTEEIKELHQSNPELFEHDGIKNVYEKIMAEETGKENN